MSDAFDQLIPEAQAFCRDLTANNNREWYQANKHRYQAQLKRPAEMLLEKLRPGLAALTGGAATTKLFRINRDLRFAKGKPPYKDYLHMLWYAPDGGVAPLGWFFGIEKDRLRVGAGYMGFEGAALTAWRAALDGPEGATIADGIAARLAMGDTTWEPALKRVPSPYAKDHPQGDLMKYKAMVLFHDMPVPATDLPGAILSEFRTLWPVFAPIHRAMTA